MSRCCPAGTCSDSGMGGSAARLPVAHAASRPVRAAAIARCIPETVTRPPALRRARSFGHVADGFDVVAVGIEYEGAIVVLVVVRTQSGCSIVATAGLQRRAIK